jgi:hypothetical protein
MALRLLDSWRSSSNQGVPDRPALNKPEVLTADVLRQRAVTRIAVMETADLLDFIEANLGGMGRNIRDWRGSRDLVHLDEAHLAAEVQQIAVSELIRRSSR